jgi:hypothetical protein
MYKKKNILHFSNNLYNYFDIIILSVTFEITNKNTFKIQ